MAKYKYSEAKIGVFVLGAMLLILATTIYVKGFILGRDFVSKTAIFESVPGLSVGDPVTVRGVKQGQVERIKLEGTVVEVGFSIHKDIKLYTDYKIEVAVLELMGGKQLAVDPGTSMTEVSYDTPLQGTTGADISNLFQSMNSLTTDVSELLESFQKNSENLDEVLVNINDIVGDPRLKNDLKNTMTNFALTSQQLGSLVAENRVNLNRLTDKVGYTIDNVNTVFDETTPEFKKTFQEIQVLTNRVDSLIVNLNSVIVDIKNPNYGAGKFIYDDSMYENINATLKEIEKLTKKIREDGVKINLF